jgi:hypothetical protein
MHERRVVLELYQGILFRGPGHVSQAEISALSPVVAADGGVVRAIRMMLESEEFKRKARYRVHVSDDEVQLIAARRERQLLFDHIPKTAGRSVVAFLEELLGPRSVLDVNATEDLLAVPFAELLTARVVAGHLGLQALQWAPWLSRFTVLRNPLQRLVSQYAHLRRELLKEGDLASLAERSQVSRGFEFWFEGRLERGEQNTQAIWLTQPLIPDSNTPGHVPRWGLPGLHDQEDLLSRALAALRQLSLVGAIEEFDFVACRLSDWFELSASELPDISRRNEGGETTEIIATMRPGLRSRVEQAEVIDFELWEQARHLAR